MHGPNGFLTQFSGDASGSGAGVEVTASIGRDGELRLTAVNGTKKDVRLNLRSLLRGDEVPAKERTVWLAPGERETLRFEPLRTSHGWYDFAVGIAGDSAYLRRFAGHLENGRPSVAG